MEPDTLTLIHRALDFNRPRGDTVLLLRIALPGGTVVRSPDLVPGATREVIVRWLRDTADRVEAAP